MASRHLRLELADCKAYKELILVTSRDPRSWKALPEDDSGYQSFAVALAAGFVDHVESDFKTQLGSIYISVEQDAAGRHFFVSLGEARTIMEEHVSQQLVLLPEDKVKALRDDSGALLLYARPASEMSLMSRIRSESGHSQVAPDDDEPEDLNSIETPKVTPQEVRKNSKDLFVTPDRELCPHSSPWARNYSVIPELSVGRTQLLILCDEATLTRSLPEERIFEFLKLVVNCHESRLTPGKYKVGCCVGKDSPNVICQSVHEWHSLDDQRMNRVNDEIQQSMWDALQSGTVAVHCLAGIHRAACIVACHFLWRYYTLGHRDVPCDPNVIYQKLRAVRPAVSPAYTHVLQKYEAHLKRQAGSKR
mmetsp:Transcript_23098/g.36908  ORF Transcript_23098/g.36908 Transcript_23098/m.36908 type:complete len:363 (-) Transcript_23098:72-1160(-)